MSLDEEENQLSGLSMAADTKQEEPKKAKITYAVDFLLSLRNFQLCKQLPSGFDKSVLSMFHEAFYDSQEKAKTSSVLATQNLRRTEYSASPPTRRDVSSYTRGSAGKWESHSRDSDSQSDRDSESGRQFGTHARRPWQNSEHDGLLGSGSLPKLTGYTSGTSVPKFRATDQNQLNRSNAPYQPPRPYKAVPHNRSATSDLHNDETFGSAEITSEDQAEEERKRRAEFELMRKERTKPSQNKQYSSLVSSKDDLVSDIAENQGNQIEEKNILSEANESQMPPTILAPKCNSTKSSSFLPTPAARPLVPPGFVPPGFTNTNGVAKPAIKQDTKGQTPEISNHLVPVTLNSSIGGISGVTTMKQPDDQSHLNTKNHVGDIDLLANGKGLDSKKGPIHHIAAEPGQNLFKPQLEDMFGSSLTIDDNGLSISTERKDQSLHDKWKRSSTESSKFARWFIENDVPDKVPKDGGLSEKPIDLFALVGVAPTSTVDAKTAKSTDTSAPVLTCEDLEQSILSEMSQRIVPSETPSQGSETRDVYEAERKASIDALGSQHLLSMLRKEPGQNDIGQSLSVRKSSSSTEMDIATQRLKQQEANKVSVVVKNPTLEAIFGSAFMKELQASDAPVSTKRNSISDLPRFQLPEDEIFTTGSDRLNQSNSFHENNPGYAPSNLPLGNPDKLGALSAMFSDVRSVRQSQDSHVFPRDSYDTVDYNSVFQNIRAHSSQSQLHSQHMSQRSPMFNHLDTNQPSSHMRFTGNIINHESPASHQFSPSPQIFNQLRPVGFEPLNQYPMMQQPHLQSSAGPPHFARQYSGNVPQPPNQVIGFRQELDPLHGLHIGRQLPGNHGFGTPAPDIGSGNHHPEVLQRLMEMERRSNQKQSHPFAGHLGQLPNF